MRTIYGLVDPRDEQIRYVGATARPLAAYLQSHVYGARKRGTYGQWVNVSAKDRWLRQLLDAGLAPRIVALHEVEDAVWREAEADVILSLRGVGCPLTNMRVGGAGGSTRADRAA